MVNQQTLGTYGLAGVEQEFSELALIIDQLQKVRRSTALQVSDDLLLDAAIRLHITTQINRQRPGGVRKSGGATSTQQKAEAMATERQLKYLRSLGATIPERLTKMRASQIIEEYKQKEETRNLRNQ